MTLRNSLQKARTHRFKVSIPPSLHMMGAQVYILYPALTIPLMPTYGNSNTQTVPVTYVCGQKLMWLSSSWRLLWSAAFMHEISKQEAKVSVFWRSMLGTISGQYLSHRFFVCSRSQSESKSNSNTMSMTDSEKWLRKKGIFLSSWIVRTSIVVLARIG